MARWYDGSARWDQVESALRRQGYVCQFACTYSDSVPDELEITGHENGWEMRRKLKRYCEANRIADYEIVRNTGYRADLHGNAVYELWTRAASSRSPEIEAEIDRLKKGNGNG